MVRLLERECQYQSQLNELRDELSAVKDFSISEHYDKLAVGQYGIIITSLNRFLSVNGFYMRQTDTDAILRRFDHNADQSLGFSEFHELCTGVERAESEKAEEKEEPKAEAEAEAEEPEEEEKAEAPKEEEEEVKSPQVASEGEFNDYTPGLKAAPEESSPERRYRQQQEQSYAFLRLLKAVLHANGRIASYKDQLAKHTFFNASDLFFEFDRGNKGYLTLEDFDRGFASYFNPDKLEEKMSPQKSSPKKAKEEGEESEKSEAQLDDVMRGDLATFMELAGAQDG